MTGDRADYRLAKTFYRYEYRYQVPGWDPPSAAARLGVGYVSVECGVFQVLALASHADGDGSHSHPWYASEGLGMTLPIATAVPIGAMVYGAGRQGLGCVRSSAASPAVLRWLLLAAWCMAQGGANCVDAGCRCYDCGDRPCMDLNDNYCLQRANRHRSAACCGSVHGIALAAGKANSRVAYSYSNS